MSHRNIVLLAALATVPGLAGAFTPPVPNPLLDALPGEAEAASGHINLEIRCRHGDTEIGDEELFVRWGYGSDLHSETTEYTSGCHTVATLSDTKDTSVTSTTISLYEEDCCGLEDRLDVGPTGACGSTVTINYGSNQYTAGGTTYTNGGSWATVSGGGESGCSVAGTVEFRFVW